MTFDVAVSSVGFFCFLSPGWRWHAASLLEHVTRVYAIQEVAYMAESSWLKRIWDNLTGHTYVPSSEAANDTPTAPQPITPPVGLTLLHTLEGHTDRVDPLAWSPDGKLLGSGSKDQTVRLWDLTTGALLHTLEGHTGWVFVVAWSPNGKLLASSAHFAQDDGVWLWDPTTGMLLHTLEGHKGAITSAAWSPDGKLLVSGSYDETVRLWDPTTGALLHTLEGNMYPVWSVAWSPDGKLLITGSSFPGPPHDADVRIWRTDTWEPIALLTGLKGFLLAAWHPRLPLVVTPGQQRGDIFIWHLDLEYLHQASPKARA